MFPALKRIILQATAIFSICTAAGAVTTGFDQRLAAAGSPVTSPAPGAGSSSAIATKNVQISAYPQGAGAPGQTVPQVSPGINLPPGTVLPPGMALPSGAAMPPGERLPLGIDSQRRDDPADQTQKMGPAPEGEVKPAKEPPLSPIERAMLQTASGTDKPEPQQFRDKVLHQFGYSFFRPEAQPFAPLVDVPVGPDYVLGAGDRISLSLWGSIEGTYELEVNRSGEIVLPRIGAVKVAGVTYGQLPRFLNGQLGRVFRDFQLSVTMGKLRLIRVYLVGQVASPGGYDISSLSTLINALSAAGGPTREGSLRNISVRREGKTVQTVDLYDFFLKGDKTSDIRLLAGDTIFVPSIGPVAGISGNVRRPAIYELKDEKNLKELLRLADGINATGYLQRLNISRVEAHQKKTVTDVNLDPGASGKSLEEMAAAIPIRDLDLVRIFPIDTMLRGYFRMEGYVLRPGDYALEPGVRISRFLQQDSLLPETNMDVAEVTRLVPPDLHPEKVSFSPARALAGDPSHDLELKEFDRVRIFSRWELEEQPTVRIGGEVQKPGQYRLTENMRVSDLLIAGGYPKRTAYLEDAEISRLRIGKGSVTSYPVPVNLAEAMKGNPGHNIILHPFDELTIRKIPNWSDEVDRYITLKGEFRFPGVYPIYKGERLSSVIRRAGGFTQHAYLRAAKFTRVSVRELQQKRMDEFIATAEQEVTRKMAEAASAASSQEELQAVRASLEGVRSNLQLLKASKAEGRMVIRLDQPERFATSPYDVEAMGGDVLEVPQPTYSVSVLGRVVNPTSFIILEGASVGDYLEKAGGVSSDSEEDEMYVIRADGSVFSKQQYSSFASLFGGGFKGEPLYSGDTVVVPQRYDRTPWLRTVKDITTIMSQIAITAGTVLLGLK